MITKFQLLDEARRYKLIIPYEIENDNFIREVRCKEHESGHLTRDRKYRVYAEFESGAMISGKCIVVFCDSKDFVGFDSEYFLEEFEWEASRKYNL
jgi:hypothetical protein